MSVKTHIIAIVEAPLPAPEPGGRDAARTGKLLTLARWKRHTETFQDKFTSCQ